MRNRRPKALRRPYRSARIVAALGLLGVAILGAVNSWGSMYESALYHLGGVHLPTIHGVSVAGATVPLLLDALIVVASLRYVVGVKEQRPVAGWRVAAHSGIAGTVVMNALSAARPSDIPWHIIAPAVLSLVVELTARDILGQLREVRRVDSDRIPLRLWLSSPAESARTSWRMARTGERSATAARVASDTCAAASYALRRALPDRPDRTVRRQITRRLWAGTIEPGDVFAACGWADADGPAQLTPEAVLRAALGRLTGPVQDVVEQPTELAQSTEVGHFIGLAHPVNAQVSGVVDRPETPVSPAAVKAVLRAVRSGQPMGKAAIVAATGLGRSTVSRAVKELVQVGQLTTVGDARRPDYVLAQSTIEVAR